jgi:hypothetical protein
MMQDRLTAAIQKHAQELYDKASAMNGDLEAAAKSLGLAVKTSEPFTRSGAIRDLDSATRFGKGFSLPDGTVFGPIPLNSDTASLPTTRDWRHSAHRSGTSFSKPGFEHKQISGERVGLRPRRRHLCASDVRLWSVRA